ncbi:MAG: hypothetical protein ABI679_15485 [Gemmatimonadota bacterium]
MITKQQLSASMQRDCDIVAHLFSKLSPDAYDYRPSPGQRTTLELLQYLAICVTIGLRCMTEKDWKLFAGLYAHARELKAEDFPEAMDRQKSGIATFFDSVSEQTLETDIAPLPGGLMLPLGEAVMNGPAKWLTAYKMQLFLYVKATSAPEITTPNLWAGVDRR